MDAWANIETTPDDPEVRFINDFEKRIGNIPHNVRRVRKLISGFEVCHFKCERHMDIIKNSIHKLMPGINPESIGAQHIRNEEDAWRKERSGRSHLGQNYVLALEKWLDRDPAGNTHPDEELDQDIARWLGQKEPEKERLVSLAIARLKWDWDSYGKLTGGKMNRELETQVCRLDICHYNFPKIIDNTLMGIGKLKPVEKFEGCGSYNEEIREIFLHELKSLNGMLQSQDDRKPTSRDDSLRKWLWFCLAKTIKEQAGITIPLTYNEN